MARLAPVSFFRIFCNNNQFPRSSQHTRTIRRTASSIWASVVVAPMLNRTELPTNSLDSCMACKVGESSLEPLAHAEPTEHATPATSKATKST